MLLRLSYLALTGMITILRLLPMSNTDKDVEILTLRHQLAVLQRQVDKPRLTPPDRAFLAALLHTIPRPTLRQLHLIVSPHTILRWHRDLLRRHHASASRPRQPGRPPTARSIRALVLRLARDNPGWGYRRIHGELATLGIKVAPSTVWEILKANGIQPAPHRDHLTWATFTAVGDATGRYPIVGWAERVTGQTGSTALGWAVLWLNTAHNSHSVTTWSGQYQVVDGEEHILALWLLTTETSPGDDWKSTLVGADIFQRTQPHAAQITLRQARGPASHPPVLPSE